ncbi:acetyltransferase [Staphylococcus sp. HMSC068D08]|uniref:GNAT family N-acetyltransferase n=1 Tax=Staphylococcus TaxID=1279 RepID=UPI0008A36C73|nr:MULTISPECIES: N-acetyltransferase [Staphylococcus]MCC2083461.1 GNAT family N-acetyltransferase [Staphylococcus lugdunensis]MCH8679086.1 GNAT family N-acetyltransferase [Staphylococcus lugdunensis]MCI2827510.1 GNAT family N-acetyltransferase [Staphylococcus lugdunensis]MCI2837122.1 GNAT family N-acetyltransferase [Staphylococcus lugdunensis]MCM3466740.1 GNAT family N-acetyltransferase [Staphylococcus lugdunensis]
MMTKETITAVQASEIEDLQAIAQRTFHATFEGSYSEADFSQFFAENYNLDILTTEFHNPESFHYFYKVKGQIVGYLKLNIDAAQTEAKGPAYLEIQRIYFDKAYQGGGRGKKFIQLALNKALEYQKTKAWLGVWEHNPQALAFYKTCGFKVTGQHEFKTGDVIDIDLIMERSVSD